MKRSALPALRLALLVLALWSLAGVAQALDRIDAFVGDYKGSADVVTRDGQTIPRDMSVSIRRTKDGFAVQWASTTWHAGKARTKSYNIGFVQTDRDDVFAAAMTRDVFGHASPLDPMKGEPYVWARIKGDTLTVFSLFVDSDGGYEIQQFDRTLVEGGLELRFTRLRNGEPERAVSTFLTRQ